MRYVTSVSVCIACLGYLSSVSFITRYDPDISRTLFYTTQDNMYHYCYIIRGGLIFINNIPGGDLFKGANWEVGAYSRIEGINYGHTLLASAETQKLTT